MAMTKRTLRRMKPRTRRFAQALNDLELATRRLKALLPVLQEMELYAEASERRETPAEGS